MMALSFGLKPMCAVEVQAHGLIFEHWVCDTFFLGYRPEGYTQKWDIPAIANNLEDPELRALPVNPKATKQGTPVGLGDALRQYDINEPFILIIGYWTQVDPKRKQMVEIVACRVAPDKWRQLWGKVTRKDLERIDALIKDRTLSADTVRRRIQELKEEPPFTETVFVLNPKIDSKSQRRLQCSLRYVDIMKHFVPNQAPNVQSKRPMLWGVEFTKELESARRTFLPRKPTADVE